MAMVNEQADSEEVSWDPWDDESKGKHRKIVGLDLGRDQDHTGLVVVEHTDLSNIYSEPIDLFLVSYVERFPLGMSYVQVVDKVAKLATRPELLTDTVNTYGRRYRATPMLVVDATGVGRPVVDMLEKALRPWRGTYSNVESIVIHGGRTSGRSEDGRSWNVSKIDLVTSAQMALGEKRLRIVRSLPHADLLRRELQDYRIEISETGRESFNARSGAHDDLLLALCVALWYASYAYR